MGCLGWGCVGPIGDGVEDGVEIGVGVGVRNLELWNFKLVNILLILWFELV